MLSSHTIQNFYTNINIQIKKDAVRIHNNKTGDSTVINLDLIKTAFKPLSYKGLIPVYIVLKYINNSAIMFDKFNKDNKNYKAHIHTREEVLKTLGINNISMHSVFTQSQYITDLTKKD